MHGKGKAKISYEGIEEVLEGESKEDKFFA